MESRGVQTAHQYARTESCQNDSFTSQPPDRVCHLSGNRQLHCHCVCQQGRGYPVQRADERNFQTVQSSGVKRLEDQGSVYTRQAEHSGRHTLKKGSSTDNRMVNQTGCSRQYLQDVVQTNDRLVRNQVQQQMSNVHLTSTRPTSSGSRRSVSGSRGKRVLRLSSSSDTATDPPEVSNDFKVQDDCDSSVVGKTSLVSNPESVDCDRTHTDSHLQEPIKTALDRQVPLQSRNVEPPRLAARKKYLIQQGYSEKVVQRIVTPQAKSSTEVYDGQYRVYLDWCRQEGVQHDNPTLQQVTLYLQYLFDVKKYEYSTIASHRSVLSSALKDHTDLNIGQSEILTDLLRSFRREKPPRSHCQPEWDLAFILWSLTRPPFEDIKVPGKVQLAHLAWKTLFLTLLASGSRRGEIHAIKKKSVKFAENNEYVTMTPSPEFIPKSGMRRSQALKPIKIYCLCDVLPEKEKEDRALCPVRCLKKYLETTKKARKDRKDRRLLFIPLTKKKGEVHKNTLSSWVRKLILFCYQNPSEAACELLGTRTHDIRGFAHSLTFNANVPVEDLLQAGSWKSHTVFTSHYLKDLTEIDTETLLRLGPIVAGQKIVLHSKI